MSHDKHWLSLVSDLKVVLFEEVLGNTNLRSIFHLEEGCGWTLIKLDILDYVSLFIAIVGDDTCTSKLSSASILELEENS